MVLWKVAFAHTSIVLAPRDDRGRIRRRAAPSPAHPDVVEGAGLIQTRLAGHDRAEASTASPIWQRIHVMMQGFRMIGLTSLSPQAKHLDAGVLVRLRIG